MSLLSIGSNRKLGKKIGVFNLPHGVTCPSSTVFCKKVCYAAKAARYPAVMKKRAINYACTKQSTFVDDLIKEIQDEKLDKVRIHESGDVYDQAYLDALIRVAWECTDVKFLMYTKSWHLDWSTKPANMVVYWSIDKTTVGIPPKGLVAMTVAKGDAVPIGLITCPDTMDKNYCGSQCLICWNGLEHVYFNQH